MRKLMAVFVVLVFGLSLAGCATNGYYDPGRSAAAGALGGAATGAALGSIIGAATGSPATGAWVGAATGAVAGLVGGYLYAEHQNRQRANYAQAQQQYNYNPSQGYMVTVSEANVTPATVRPGQQANLFMSYTILAPQNTPTQVTLYREVRKDGALVGQPYQTTVTNYPGSYTDQVGFIVPNNATPGTYVVTNRVISSYGTGERVSYFTVM
ncbi:MAG: glycine zipper family protein [Deltaproteobacteria bacterium]|nr:glycine zipper family protein [Deltaproteobacteria bacterium]